MTPLSSADLRALVKLRGLAEKTWELVDCVYVAADGTRHKADPALVLGAINALVPLVREVEALRAKVAEMEARWRPEVTAFADAMENELRENDHKGGWQDDAATSLVKRVIEETGELAREVKRPHEWKTPERWQERVLAEAADVANFAMMVADVCGALRRSAPRGPR